MYRNPMREIKFQGMDDKNKIYDVDVIAWHSMTALCKIDNAIGTVRCLFKAFRQYTGQKDRHGKEVYEGDIVEDVHCNIGAVTWNLDRWSLFDGDRYWSPTHYDLCGVLGNIYQNPELIKELYIK